MLVGRARFELATNGLKVDQSVGCSDLPYMDIGL